MKLLYTILLLGLWGFLFGGSLTGCATSGSDTYATASKDGPRLNEKKVQFDGTVRTGDPVTIHSDNGNVYQPLNLPGAYRHDGMRVRVFGVTRGADLPGGQPLDIVEIGSLNSK